MALEKTVLITGGSSGIGYAISRHFARAGYRILWVSLLKQEIENAKIQLEKEIVGTKVNALAQDLALQEASEKVYNWVQSNQWEINVLINNAGFGTYGFTNDIDVEKELNMISLNLVCVYKMTRLFLKDMVEKNEGTIINISSNSSFQPTPKLNTYGATKAFVKHFTRSINEEMKIGKKNVKVICVCPAGIKDTNFRKTCDMDRLKTFDGLATTTAEEVAKDVWKGFIKGKSFIVSGWKMRLLYRISGLVPYGITQMLVRREISEV